MKLRRTRIVLLLALCWLSLPFRSVSWANPLDLREALLSSDRSTRDSAIEQIFQKSIPEIIHEVIPILKGLGEALERETRLLANIVTSLIIGWGYENASTRAALEALWEQKVPLYAALVPLIKTSLRDPDSQARVIGLGSIAAMYPAPPAEARRLVPVLLNDPEPRVRAAAVQTLGYMKPGTPEVRGTLLQVLKDEEDRSVRGQVFRAIRGTRVS